MIDFSQYHFHPVIPLPEGYEIYDFTSGYDPQRKMHSPFGIGRYNEDRRGMYEAGIFQDPEGARTIHVGIDIGAPVGTAVHAFFDGEIFLFGNNSQPGDYGFTLITRHFLGGAPLFALFGHLSERSVQGKRIGTAFKAGEILAWVGDRHENGGWNPHLHFQLSLEAPESCDMPGVVNRNQLAEALRKYPDPRVVLGPVY